MSDIKQQIDFKVENAPNGNVRLIKDGITIEVKGFTIQKDGKHWIERDSNNSLCAEYSFISKGKPYKRVTHDYFTVDDLFNEEAIHQKLIFDAHGK